MPKFPVFYYESKACWGEVRSLDDLKGMCDRQIAENNNIKSEYDFKDLSRQDKYGGAGFGTRREHTGMSLSVFLSSHCLLVDFLKMYFDETEKKIEEGTL